jgi:hypothetical protein
MMAQESDKEEDISEAVMNIIDACTTGLDARKLPIFDIEYIFLQLRTKSVGETADIKVKCPDDDKTFVDVNLKLDEIAVHMTENHTNIVQLTDKISMIMKYPVMTDKELDEFIDTMDTKQFENIMEFFNTMPKLRHSITVTNPKTKKKGEVMLEGLDSFLA